MSCKARRRALLVAGCLLLAAACGKKGPPLPPLKAVPAPARDLSVRQQGNRLLLELAYPKLTPAGTALAGVSGAEVWEVVRPLPPTTAPADAKPPQLEPREIAAAAKLRLKLAAADVGAATRGDRLIVELPAPTASTLEAHYFAVRTRGPEGDLSQFSNQVSIVPRTPPAAPAEVKLEPRADGIQVSWTPVEGAAGYAVYRRESQVRAYGAPVHVGGAEEQSFLDTAPRMGASYIYAVTGLASPEPRIESEVRSEQEVRYADRFPPPPVADLVALAETGKVRLIWTASAAPDLAGYRVYRRDAAGEFRLLTPQPVRETEYTDTSIAPGLSYAYQVTAADAAGNESEPREVPAATR